jgi:hypothetical protein
MSEIWRRWEFQWKMRFEPTLAKTKTQGVFTEEVEVVEEEEADEGG